MAVFWVLRRWVTNMVIAKQYTKTDDARIGWPGNDTVLWILI